MFNGCSWGYFLHCAEFDTMRKFVKEKRKLVIVRKEIKETGHGSNWLIEP